jgi:hypothetical protein
MFNSISSLADLLYGQLVEQSNPAGQAEPSSQLVEGEKPFVMDWAALKCSGPVSHGNKYDYSSTVLVKFKCAKEH